YNWWPWGQFWVNPPGPANPALKVFLPVYSCPSEPRNLTHQAVIEASYPPIDVAFTDYLGVAGQRGDLVYPSSNTKYGPSLNGIFLYKSKVRFADIPDGTSNTLMVGERPPSADLVWGWWFAGSGWDNWGEGDVVLGTNAVPYANSIAPACKSNPKVGLQEGN